MIEKVARAMIEQSQARVAGMHLINGIPMDGTEDFMVLARAAIEAMEIPTAEMINAGINCDDWADGEQDATKLIASTFSAMIKEAIK